MTHRTSIIIDDKDWEYIKKWSIKPTHAFRAFVRDHRANMNDPDANPSTMELKRKVESALKRLEDMRDFMQKKGVMDEYLGI